MSVSDQLEALRQRAPLWTLADDSQLCTLLESIARSFSERSAGIEKQLVAVGQQLSSIDGRVASVHCDLDAYSETQFIEQKVVDEAIVPKPDEKEVPMSLADRQQETLSAVRAAVADGLSLLNAEFAPTTLTAADLGLPPDTAYEAQTVYQPRDSYDGAMPPLIGSAEFHAFAVGERKEVATAAASPLSPPVSAPPPPPPPPAVQKEVTVAPEPTRAQPPRIQVVPAMPPSQNSLFDDVEEEEEDIAVGVGATGEHKWEEDTVSSRSSVVDDGGSARSKSSNGAGAGGGAGAEGGGGGDEKESTSTRGLPRPPALQDIIAARGKMGKDPVVEEDPVPDARPTLPASAPAPPPQPVQAAPSASAPVKKVAGVKLPAPQHRSVFDSDSDDDAGLFAALKTPSVKPPQSTPVEKVKTVPAPPVAAAPSAAAAVTKPPVVKDVKKPPPPRSKGLFDSDSDDDDLFSSYKATAFAAPAAQPLKQELESKKEQVVKVDPPKKVEQPPPKKVDVVKPVGRSLFSDDSDDDLFSSIARKPSTVSQKKEEQQVKSAPVVEVKREEPLPVVQPPVVAPPVKEEETPPERALPEAVSEPVKSDHIVASEPVAAASVEEVKEVAAVKAEPVDHLSTLTEKDRTDPRLSESVVEEEQEQSVTVEPVVPSEVPKQPDTHSFDEPPAFVELEQPPPPPEDSPEPSPPVTEKEEEQVARPPRVQKVLSEDSWDAPPPLPAEHQVDSDEDAFPRGVSSPDDSRPSTPLDSVSDDDEEMRRSGAAPGKLNAGAFANKLAATLGRPPPAGGVRLPGLPGKDEKAATLPRHMNLAEHQPEQMGERERSDAPSTAFRPPPPRVSSAAAASAGEQPPALFDDKWKGTTNNAVKSRPRGPPRRPPSKAAPPEKSVAERRPSTERTAAAAPRKVSTDKPASEKPAASAPLTRRPSAEKPTTTTVPRASAEKPIATLSRTPADKPTTTTTTTTVPRASGEKLTTTTTTVPRPAEKAAVQRKSSVEKGVEEAMAKEKQREQQNKRMEDELDEAMKALDMSVASKPAPVKKASTTSAKKSLFDSDSDDDLFKKKPTAPRTATSTSQVRSSALPRAAQSTQPKKSAKSSLFDDSDDDLNMFKKK